jgi:hypothetical protein
MTKLDNSTLFSKCIRFEYDSLEHEPSISYKDVSITHVLNLVNYQHSQNNSESFVIEYAHIDDSMAVLNLFHQGQVVTCHLDLQYHEDVNLLTQDLKPFFEHWKKESLNAINPFN